MSTRSSITKSVAACLLGMLAAAPFAQAEVDQKIIDYAKKMTEVKKIELKGKPISKKDRIKNANRQGVWLNGYADVRDFARIKRDDDANRILCTQEMLFDKAVIFEGSSSSETQLVHVIADTDEYVVSAEEATNLKDKTGFYILFTPEVIYLLDYEAVNPETGDKEPLFRKYEGRGQ